MADLPLAPIMPRSPNGGRSRLRCPRALTASSPIASDRVTDSRLRSFRRARRSRSAAALLLFVACASSVEDRLAQVRALQDAGQFSESIEPLRELLAKNPDQAEANYLLGVALVQTGQLSLAVWPLEKASADPSQAMTAGLLLASTFLGVQAHEDAVRVATKVLDQDPDRVAALKVRAQALLGANQREKALEDTTRLRELAPDDYPALLMHATILSELDGRMDEAEKAHEELEISPPRAATRASRSAVASRAPPSTRTT